MDENIEETKSGLDIGTLSPLPEPNMGIKRMKTHSVANNNLGDEYDKSPVFLPKNSPRKLLEISFKEEVKLEDEATESPNLHKNISIDRLTSTSNIQRENSECKGGTETEFLRIDKEGSSHSEMVLKVQE